MKYFTRLSTLFNQGPGSPEVFRIAHLGGIPENWEARQDTLPPGWVVSVFDDTPQVDRDHIHYQGNIADDFSALKDGAFDLVLSVFTLERLQTFREQLRHAHQIRRIGLRYAIFTGDFSSLHPAGSTIPALHFFPLPCQRLLSWMFGGTSLPKRFLSKSEVERLFPLAVLDQTPGCFPQSMLFAYSTDAF